MVCAAKLIIKSIKLDKEQGHLKALKKKNFSVSESEESLSMY
jgi:hypothetical protein